MAKTIAAWLIRFAVFAAIFLTTAGVWIQNAQGWKSLGLLGATIGFGITATLAFLIALAVDLQANRHAVHAVLKFLLHPGLTVLLFFVITYLLDAWLFAAPWEFLWPDLRSFTALVTAAAFAEAAAGIALSRWTGPARRQAS